MQSGKPPTCNCHMQRAGGRQPPEWCPGWHRSWAAGGCAPQAWHSGSYTGASVPHLPPSRPAKAPHRISSSSQDCFTDKSKQCCQKADVCKLATTWQLGMPWHAISCSGGMIAGLQIRSPPWWRWKNCLGVWSGERLVQGVLTAAVPQLTSNGSAVTGPHSDGAKVGLLRVQEALQGEQRNTHPEEGLGVVLAPPDRCLKAEQRLRVAAPALGAGCLSPVPNRWPTKTALECTLCSAWRPVRSRISGDLRGMQSVCCVPALSWLEAVQRDCKRSGTRGGLRRAHMEASSVAVAMCAAYASSAARPCARLRSAASWRAVHLASPCTYAQSSVSNTLLPCSCWVWDNTRLGSNGFRLPTALLPSQQRWHHPMSSSICRAFAGAVSFVSRHACQASTWPLWWGRCGRSMPSADAFVRSEGALHLYSGLHCLQNLVQAVRLVSSQAQHFLSFAQLLRQRLLLCQRVPSPAAQRWHQSAGHAVLLPMQGCYRKTLNERFSLQSRTLHLFQSRSDSSLSLHTASLQAASPLRTRTAFNEMGREPPQSLHWHVVYDKASDRGLGQPLLCQPWWRCELGATRIVYSREIAAPCLLAYLLWESERASKGLHWRAMEDDWVGVGCWDGLRLVSAARSRPRRRQAAQHGAGDEQAVRQRARQRGRLGGGRPGGRCCCCGLLFRLRQLLLRLHRAESHSQSPQYAGQTIHMLLGHISGLKCPYRESLTVPYTSFDH